jgi:predicted  nucleic acid-binding Zn-ribbon protein
MKLNPFAKKTPGYLAGIKADHARIQKELADKTTALQTARDELTDRQHDLVDEEARFPHRHSRTETEIALHRQVEAGQVQVGTLEYAVRDLQRELSQLSGIVNASADLKEAKATLTGLRTVRQGLQGHQAQLEGQSRKLKARIETLEARQYADIERAGLAMISAESEEPIPDSVARTDTELRVAKTALAQLEQQIQTVKDELTSLPEQLRDAMAAFQRCRATVAEVEMKEQVHSLAAVFAKASVTAYLRNFQGAPNKLEIEIPDDVVEVIRSELAAEVMDD